MEISVLTLNCWGLWLVSRQREQRMAALAAFLRCLAALYSFLNPALCYG